MNKCWENDYNTSFVPHALSRLTLCDLMDCIAHQALLSMGFPRQGYWSGLPFASPGDLPHPGCNPCLLRLLPCRWILYLLSHQGSFKKLCYKIMIHEYSGVMFISQEVRLFSASFLFFFIKRLLYFSVESSINTIS